MMVNKGYGFALAAALIWCGFILVSRLGGVSDLLAYDVIAIRYLTCAAILLPIWRFKFYFTLFNWRLWLCSLVGGLAYALFTFHGFQSAPASHGSILLAGLIPVFIIVLSFLLLKEKQGWQRWLAVAITASGVGTLFFNQLGQLTPSFITHGFIASGFINSSDIFWADVSFILAAFCWALFSILVKLWQVSPWQVTVSLALITCVVYLPVYVLFLPKMLSQASWQDIALQGGYQGILATIVQMVLYVKAIEQIGPSAVGSVMAIVPVISGISAIYLFAEPINLALIAGLLMVSLGAWLAHSRFCLMNKLVKLKTDY
jgi:drug/metabolite transporter (DMT)-like permease